jgi:hypothetical protein
MVIRLSNSSPSPGGEIAGPSKKRHDKPPDEYAFHDPDRSINRTQAFQFRFQVALALAAVPRIRFGFSPADGALQSFSHGPAHDIALPAPPGRADVRTRVYTTGAFFVSNIRTPGKFADTHIKRSSLTGFICTVSGAAVSILSSC